MTVRRAFQICSVLAGQASDLLDLLDHLLSVIIPTSGPAQWLEQSSHTRRRAAEGYGNEAPSEEHAYTIAHATNDQVDAFLATVSAQPKVQPMATIMEESETGGSPCAEALAAVTAHASTSMPTPITPALGAQVTGDCFDYDSSQRACQRDCGLRKDADGRFGQWRRRQRLICRPLWHQAPVSLRTASGAALRLLKGTVRAEGQVCIDAPSGAICAGSSMTQSRLQPGGTSALAIYYRQVAEFTGHALHAVSGRRFGGISATHVTHAHVRRLHSRCCSFPTCLWSLGSLGCC